MKEKMNYTACLVEVLEFPAEDVIKTSPETFEENQFDNPFQWKTIE